MAGRQLRRVRCAATLHIPPACFVTPRVYCYNHSRHATTEDDDGDATHHDHPCRPPRLQLNKIPHLPARRCPSGLHATLRRARAMQTKSVPTLLLSRSCRTSAQSPCWHDHPNSQCSCPKRYSCDYETSHCHVGVDHTTFPRVHWHKGVGNTCIPVHHEDVRKQSNKLRRKLHWMQPCNSQTDLSPSVLFSTTVVELASLRHTPKPHTPIHNVRAKRKSKCCIQSLIPQCRMPGAHTHAHTLPF